MNTSISFRIIFVIIWSRDRSMSSISIDIPVLQINPVDLQNIVKFIFAHECSLREFGAIKIQLSSECTLALKKGKIPLICTSTEQITKVSGDKLIYSVEKSEDINKYARQRLPITNEKQFWLSLFDSMEKCRLPSVSILPNKSLFYEKWQRKYFALHYVPRQSLLRIAGSKTTKQFAPCLARAHGPGAIFPLASAQQRLFSIVYHHQGGARHWYIIPAYEREALQKILQRRNPSNCLEHEELFINPILFDRHSIRYHRVIQYPNEFMVLAAGALAQSFTEDACWTESAVFALPSWIEEGHATARQAPCQCNINISTLPKTIDMSLFKHETIQKYINSYLKTANDGKTSVIKLQTMPFASMESNASLQAVVTTFDDLPSSSFISSISNCSLNNGINDELPWKPCRENMFHNATNYEIHLPTFTGLKSQNYFSASSYTDGSQCYRSSTPMETPENLHSYAIIEDFMDTTSYMQINELFNASEKNQNEQQSSGSAISRDAIRTNTRKTLFVSRLRNDVNKTDLHHHFTGCVKVILKQCQTASHYKYAFVLHKTKRDTQRNYRKPIDHTLLGPACFVEYAGDEPSLPIRYRLGDERTVVVKSIPENVSENDLRCLFINCHVLKYCPAQIIYRMSTATTAPNRAKILSGYAFLMFDNEPEAKYVIEHVDQYQIGGQSLSVSRYSNTK